MSKWIKLKDIKLHFIKPSKFHYIKLYRGRTNYWFVEDFKDYPLGTIKWCPRLKKYAFFPDTDSIGEFLFRSYEPLELKIMAKFIKDQMKKRKTRTSTCNDSKCKADYPEIDDSYCLSQLIKLEDL